MKRYKYSLTSFSILLAVIFALFAGDVNSEEGRDTGRICFNCHPELEKAVHSQIAHRPAKK